MANYTVVITVSLQKMLGKLPSTIADKLETLPSLVVAVATAKAVVGIEA